MFFSSEKVLAGLLTVVGISLIISSEHAAADLSKRFDVIEEWLSKEKRVSTSDDLRRIRELLDAKIVDYNQELEKNHDKIVPSPHPRYEFSAMETLAFGAARWDKVESLLVLHKQIIACRYFDELKSIDKANICDELNLRRIQSAFAALEANRSSKLAQNRRIDLIVKEYRDLAAEKCGLNMFGIVGGEFKEKELLVSLESVRDQLDTECVTQLDFNFVLWRESKGQQSSATAWQLYDEYIKPDSLDSNWDSRVAKDLVLEACVNAPQSSKVDSQNWRQVLVERRLVGHCQKYVEGAESIFKQAKKFDFKPPTRRGYNDLPEVNQFYKYWSQFKQCQHIIKLGAEQVVKSAGELTDDDDKKFFEACYGSDEEEEEEDEDDKDDDEEDDDDEEEDEEENSDQEEEEKSDSDSDSDDDDDDDDRHKKKKRWWLF